MYYIRIPILYLQELYKVEHIGLEDYKPMDPRIPGSPSLILGDVFV